LRWATFRHVYQLLNISVFIYRSPRWSVLLWRHHYSQAVAGICGSTGSQSTTERPVGSTHQKQLGLPSSRENRFSDAFVPDWPFFALRCFTLTVDDRTQRQRAALRRHAIGLNHSFQYSSHSDPHGAGIWSSIHRTLLQFCYTFIEWSFSSSNRIIMSTAVMTAGLRHVTIYIEDHTNYQSFTSKYEKRRRQLGEVHHYRDDRRYSWKRKTTESLERWHQRMDTSVNRRGAAADQGSCSLEMEKRCSSSRQCLRQRIRHQRRVLFRCTLCTSSIYTLCLVTYALCRNFWAFANLALAWAPGHGLCPALNAQILGLVVLWLQTIVVHWWWFSSFFDR